MSHSSHVKHIWTYDEISFWALEKEIKTCFVTKYYQGDLVCTQLNQFCTKQTFSVRFCTINKNLRAPFTVRQISLNPLFIAAVGVILPSSSEQTPTLHTHFCPSTQNNIAIYLCAHNFFLIETCKSRMSCAALTVIQTVSGSQLKMWH